MPRWDAHQYLRFAGERTQPAIDLLGRVAVEAPRRAIDLGCGPGNSTALLHERWPAAEVVGLDSSAEMIAAASKTYPDWKWVQADAADWTAAEPYDVIFSNAAFQWVPDHARLFPRLLAQVATGGALAVQMPAHLTSPIHHAMVKVAQEPAWRDRLHAAAKAIDVGTPSFYYDLLQPLAGRLDLWVTEYFHVLAGPAAVIDWMRGTGLPPFLQALAADAERAAFEARLLAEITPAYPPRCDGRVLFLFRRLFVIAYRNLSE